MGSVGSGLQQQLPSSPLVGETLGDTNLGEALDTSLYQQLCTTRRSGQVMTEEQLEALRRQISVYATICQQLVEMHKASLLKEISATGIMTAGVQPPSVVDQVMMTPMLHRATVRQRWTPSQNQLQILERLFEQGNGTPSKQRIKEITTELLQHGHVGETNVYNWFQNRKARAKRKQQLLPKDDGSEVDTDAESTQTKQLRSELDPRQGDSGGVGDSDAGRSSDGRAQTGLDQWNGNVYQPGAATAVLLQSEADICPDFLAFSRTPSLELDNLQGEKQKTLIQQN